MCIILPNFKQQFDTVSSGRRNVGFLGFDNKHDNVFLTFIFSVLFSYNSVADVFE